MARPGFLKVFLKTLNRDLRGLIFLKKTDFRVNRFKNRNATVPQVFQENVRKFPNKVVLANNERDWTLLELDEFSNRIADNFRRAGFKPGDEVALFMRSCPEYIGIWLGLAKAGLVTALLNTNQRMNPLVHSINVVKAKAVIFDKGLIGAIQEVQPELLARDVKYYLFGSRGDSGALPTNIKDLSEELKQLSGKFDTHNGNFTDRLLYIYTSGTTGLPKAAVIKHSRYFVSGVGIQTIMEMTPDDIVYTCLPLYHFAGGIMGSSQAVLYANKVAIRSKFSVSNYWDECIKYKATIGQYVGEFCRYLQAQPDKPVDKQHSIRLMFGNGIRPIMYASFKERFAIKDVVEVYGTSEGNAQILNIDNTAGSCGFLPQLLPTWLLNKIYPVALIKCDHETGEPTRNADGFCIRCKPGETGQFIGRIEDKDPLKAFDGYTNKEASDKKIITDVFTKGDKFFASGDLLAMDDYGYLYFKDRTGDTFRWKGENVSTTEVESVVSKVSDLADCVVYAVEIPGCEGKAGMVAIEVSDSKLDLDELLAKLKKNLPPYAIPVLVRLVKKLEQTATWKIPKNVLQKEAFDVNRIKDPIFLLDPQATKYQPLDELLYKELSTGKVSF